MRFKNRDHAADELIKLLRKEAVEFDIVLALPRGSVPMGAKIARTFNKPFGLIIPRKIGSPENEEYAIGAITENGQAVWNEAEKARVDQTWLAKKINQEIEEAKRRRRLYLKNREPLELKDKKILLIDDGIATGLTIKAAINDLKQKKAAVIIVAVPVAPSDTVAAIGKLVDKIMVLNIPSKPETLFGFVIGQYYDEFKQVEDEEVIKELENVTNQ